MSEYAKKMFNLEVAQRELHTQLARKLDDLRDLRQAARHVDEVFGRHRQCNQLPAELYDALNELSHLLEKGE